MCVLVVTLLRYAWEHSILLSPCSYNACSHLVCEVEQSPDLTDKVEGWNFVTRSKRSDAREHHAQLAGHLGKNVLHVILYTLIQYALSAIPACNSGPQRAMRAAICSSARTQFDCTRDLKRIRFTAER